MTIQKNSRTCVVIPHCILVPGYCVIVYNKRRQCTIIFSGNSALFFKHLWSEAMKGRWTSTISGAGPWWLAPTFCPFSSPSLWEEFSKIQVTSRGRVFCHRMHRRFQLGDCDLMWHISETKRVSVYNNTDLIILLEYHLMLPHAIWQHSKGWERSDGGVCRCSRYRYSWWWWGQRPWCNRSRRPSRCCLHSMQGGGKAQETG